MNADTSCRHWWTCCTGINLDGYAQFVPMKPETAVRRASERLDAAVSAYIDALEQLPDGPDRVEAAQDAADQTARARSRLLHARDRAVADYWDSSELSLAKLSKRLGGRNRQVIYRMAQAGRQEYSAADESPS